MLLLFVSDCFLIFFLFFFDASGKNDKPQLSQLKRSEPQIYKRGNMR